MQLDYVILGMLALRRLSGYDLRRWMEGPGAYLGYGVQLPQIYRRLSKLVERGWVEFKVDPRTTAPDAKLYALTEEGTRALMEWAGSPYEPSFRPMDPDFNLRLIFAGQLDPKIAISILRTELDYRRKQLTGPDFADYGVHSGPGPELTSVDPEWVREVHLLIHEKGYASTNAYITWLELTLERLVRRYDP